MHLNPIACAVASLLLAAGANAQQTFVRDFARYEAKIWSSPFRNPKKTALVGIPLAGATAGLLAWDQRLINADVPQAHRWGIRMSHAGDFSMLLGGTLALWGSGRLLHNETVSEMGRDSLMAMLTASVVNTGLKSAVRRRRPDGSNRWGFPSGHAATTFAIASSIAMNPKAPRWARIALPVAAGAVGFARVGARRHYPSDVAVGAALGWLIGCATRH